MTKRFKTIDRKDLLGMMNSGQAFKLVDVLSRESFEREHIKGSISLPADKIQTLAKQFLNKKDIIVVYCASFDCHASTAAAEKLTEMGYENVMDYKGGLKDYLEADLTLEGSCWKGVTRKAGCSAF
jgi:rhodanese-related sulfurtransferase